MTDHATDLTSLPPLPEDLDSTAAPAMDPNSAAEWFDALELLADELPGTSPASRLAIAERLARVMKERSKQTAA